MRLARAARPNAHLLQLSEMRLPLIAFIDVILFILMYFLLAGTIDAEAIERGDTHRAGEVTVAAATERAAAIGKVELDSNCSDAAQVIPAPPCKHPNLPKY